jgi:hypothetical protein
MNPSPASNFQALSTKKKMGAIYREEFKEVRRILQKNPAFNGLEYFNYLDEKFKHSKAD